MANTSMACHGTRHSMAYVTCNSVWPYTAHPRRTSFCPRLFFYFWLLCGAIHPRLGGFVGLLVVQVVFGPWGVRDLSGSIMFCSVLSCSVWLRWVPFGSVCFRSVRFGSIRFRSVRFDSVRFGSVRFGSVRFGSVEVAVR